MLVNLSIKDLRLFEIQMRKDLFVAKTWKSMKDVFIKHAFGPESVFRLLLFILENFEADVFNKACQELNRVILLLLFPRALLLIFLFLTLGFFLLFLIFWFFLWLLFW